MSVNSSNSSHPSSTNLYYLLAECFSSTAGLLSNIAFIITNILFLLPLFTLVLYLGHQRWRQQRSAMSHTDLFTCHMVIIELMSVLGSALSCCSILIDLPVMMIPALYLLSINLTGQMFFHMLTCVERYVAVVHPVIYLGLRQASGIRARNITIGCIWLLCFVFTGFMSLQYNILIMIPSFFLTALVLIIILFCCLSVLWVLIRPGPGEGGGSRLHASQSKLRAFYTIMAILGVLLLRVGGNMLHFVTYISPKTDRCGLWLSTPWYCLPSTLVLPLLFLHRAGKLPCCKNSTESGQGSQ